MLAWMKQFWLGCCCCCFWFTNHCDVPVRILWRCSKFSRRVHCECCCYCGKLYKKHSVTNGLYPANSWHHWSMYGSERKRWWFANISWRVLNDYVGRMDRTYCSLCFICYAFSKVSMWAMNLDNKTFSEKNALYQIIAWCWWSFVRSVVWWRFLLHRVALWIFISRSVRPGWSKYGAYH